MRNKVLAIVIICLTIISISLNVLSFNEIENVNNTENTENVENIENTEDTNIYGNLIENKTLQEQKEEVEQKLQESNNKLEYVENELTETLQKIVELDDSISEYEKKFNNLKMQIEDVESQISEREKQIQEIQEVFDKKEKILKKRMVALYEAGDTNYIDLLLSSGSIVEFVSNYFMIAELLEYDSNFLDELENSKTKMVKAKEEQEEQERKLKVARNEVNSMNIVLNNTKIIKENYVMKLSEEELKLKADIEQYKAEQEELEQKIIAATKWNGIMTIKYTGGAMIWPLAMENTIITSVFGNRLHPIQGVYKNHSGIDISGPNTNGAPVVAAADGYVTNAEWIGGYGNCVIINHGNGLVTLYGHGSEILTEVGKEVKKGDIIMRAGSTGNSTGPHVHFEVRENGVAVDPIPYLNGEIKSLDNNENLIRGIISNIIGEANELIISNNTTSDENNEFEN